MIKKLLAVIALTLALTGCAQTRTVEVTPPSCIKALDFAGEAFKILADDPQAFQGFVIANEKEITAAQQDCRDKAVDSTGT